MARHDSWESKSMNIFVWGWHGQQDTYATMCWWKPRSVFCLPDFCGCSGQFYLIGFCSPISIKDGIDVGTWMNLRDWQTMWFAPRHGCSFLENRRKYPRFAWLIIVFCLRPCSKCHLSGPQKEQLAEFHAQRQRELEVPAWLWCTWKPISFFFFVHVILAKRKLCHSHVWAGLKHPS